MISFASWATLTLLAGLPMLKIWREARPPLFSMMRSRASTPSSMKVKERPCLPAVDQLERLLEDHVRDELSEEPRAALLGLKHVVELGPDPVEGTEQGVVGAVAHAVGVDHPVEKLLRAGVDPALAARSGRRRGGSSPRSAPVRAHPVDLGGGRER